MSGDKTVRRDEDLTIDLGGLLREIRRALRWILPLVIVVAAIAFTILELIPARYRGEAKVLIESADSLYPGVTRDAEDERALLDSEGVTSQVQVLTSPELGRRVAKKVNLASYAEYDATKNASLISRLLARLGLSGDPARVSPEERLLQKYFENLNVYRLEGSRVLVVQFSAESAPLAATVANAVLDEYISMQTTAKRATTETAASVLEPQINELRKEVEKARQAVEDFRSNADLLLGSNNVPLNQQTLSEVSTQYAAAQGAEAEAEGKARLVRQLLASGEALDTTSDVLNSPIIQRLREQRVAVQARIAQLSTTLLPNHPEIKSLRSQLADYDQQLRAEAKKILDGLENDARLAKQRAAALQDRLNDLKADAAKTAANQARLAELEREADSKARQLDRLMTRYTEADTRMNARTLPADARVISRAGVPIKPYEPRVIPLTIVFALATFLLSCAYVILRAFLNGQALQSASHSGGVVGSDGREVLLAMPVPVRPDLLHASSISADHDGRSSSQGASWAAGH